LRATTFPFGAGIIAPPFATLGRLISMLVSFSEKRVPTMKKIMSKNNTSIMLVKLMDGSSS
jgi:hypothetical protein